MTSHNKVVWLDRGWQPCYYGFCPSEKAWRREMKRLIKDPLLREPYPTSNGCVTRMTNKNGGLSMLVTIHGDKERTPIEIIGLIAHEATHVFQWICEEIGEDNPSKEFEAYSIQKITQELICAFEDTRRKLTID